MNLLSLNLVEGGERPSHCAEDKRERAGGKAAIKWVFLSDFFFLSLSTVTMTDVGLSSRREEGAFLSLFD